MPSSAAWSFYVFSRFLIFLSFLFKSRMHGRKRKTTRNNFFDHNHISIDATADLHMNHHATNTVIELHMNYHVTNTVIELHMNYHVTNSVIKLHMNHHLTNSFAHENPCD